MTKGDSATAKSGCFPSVPVHGVVGVTECRKAASLTGTGDVVDPVMPQSQYGKVIGSSSRCAILSLGSIKTRAVMTNPSGGVYSGFVRFGNEKCGDCGEWVVDEDSDDSVAAPSVASPVDASEADGAAPQRRLLEDGAEEDPFRFSSASSSTSDSSSPSCSRDSPPSSPSSCKSILSAVLSRVAMSSGVGLSNSPPATKPEMAVCQQRNTKI
mmetsp:Transcript_19005/g.39351  ORF Transcript_19005/g.39351 Transcript_19005/m.39351 type:complete len:212 (-) Transcript_19005:139-774(-)